MRGNAGGQTDTDTQTDMLVAIYPLLHYGVVVTVTICL